MPDRDTWRGQTTWSFTARRHLAGFSHGSTLHTIYPLASARRPPFHPSVCTFGRFLAYLLTSTKDYRCKKTPSPPPEKGPSQGGCGEHAHSPCAALASSIQIWVYAAERMFNPFPLHFETRQPARVSLSQPLPNPDHARSLPRRAPRRSTMLRMLGGGSSWLSSTGWVPRTLRTSALSPRRPRYPSGFPPKPP